MSLKDQDHQRTLEEAIALLRALCEDQPDRHDPEKIALIAQVKAHKELFKRVVEFTMEKKDYNRFACLRGGSDQYLDLLVQCLPKATLRAIVEQNPDLIQKIGLKEFRKLEEGSSDDFVYNMNTGYGIVVDSQNRAVYEDGKLKQGPASEYIGKGSGEEGGAYRIVAHDSASHRDLHPHKLAYQAYHEEVDDFSNATVGIVLRVTAATKARHPAASRELIVMGEIFSIVTLSMVRSKLILQAAKELGLKVIVSRQEDDSKHIGLNGKTELQGGVVTKEQASAAGKKGSKKAHGAGGGHRSIKEQTGKTLIEHVSGTANNAAATARYRLQQRQAAIFVEGMKVTNQGAGGSVHFRAGTGNNDVKMTVPKAQIKDDVETWAKEVVAGEKKPVGCNEKSKHFLKNAKPSCVLEIVNEGDASQAFCGAPSVVQRIRSDLAKSATTKGKNAKTRAAFTAEEVDSIVADVLRVKFTLSYGMPRQANRKEVVLRYQLIGQTSVNLGLEVKRFHDYARGKLSATTAEAQLAKGAKPNVTAADLLKEAAKKKEEKKEEDAGAEAEEGEEDEEEEEEEEGDEEDAEAEDGDEVGADLCDCATDGCGSTCQCFCHTKNGANANADKPADSSSEDYSEPSDSGSDFTGDDESRDDGDDDRDDRDEDDESVSTSPEANKVLGKRKLVMVDSSDDEAERKKEAVAAKAADNVALATADADDEDEDDEPIVLRRSKDSVKKIKKSYFKLSDDDDE